MAGKTGPDDGVEAVPVEPTIRFENDRLLQEEDLRPDELRTGAPSQPEGPAALGVEALSEEGMRPDASAASDSGPVILSAGEGAAPDPSDAEGAPVTPGRAGPPWDWETRQGEPLSDETRLESEPVIANGGNAAALSEPPEPVRPSLRSPSVTSDPQGGAPSASSPPRQRGGIGSLLLGGMIAAALGFGAAWVAKDRLGPAELTVPADLDERLAALEARPVVEEVDTQGLAERLNEAEARLRALEEAPAPVVAPQEVGPLREEIASGLADAQARAAELEDRLAALEARPAAAVTASDGPGPAVRSTAAAPTANASAELLADLEPRLGEIETSLSAARESLSGIEAALATVEERLGTNEAALAALDEQVAGSATALQAIDRRVAEAEAAGAAAVEEARTAAASLAEAQDRATEAETQARTGAARAAIGAAIDRGEPFEGALSEVEALGVAVPETLARVAAEGVPTLADLRESFPASARAGLAAAREAGLIDEGGVLGFFRGQLSIRSTAPREGEDPDAALSRAEAALSRGQLDAALREVERLPEPVQAAMADWITRARTRADAEAALANFGDAEPDAAAAN